MMRMPAVVVRDHGDCDITNLRLAGELCFLQVRHADHIPAPTAIHVRLGLGGELRTLHADVSAPQFRGYAGGRACAVNHLRHFAAHRIAKSDVRHNAVAEESIHAVTGAVEKLGRDHGACTAPGVTSKLDPKSTPPNPTH